jgi:cation-transporting ATPase 13A1
MKKLKDLRMKVRRKVWGPNKIDIPIPKFFDVYKEHLVAPFFVF